MSHPLIPQSPVSEAPVAAPLQLSLAEGCYARTASLDLIRGQVEATVNFLESQRAPDDLEEDVAAREQRIARLQAQWAQIRAQLSASPTGQLVQVSIRIDAF